MLEHWRVKASLWLEIGLLMKITFWSLLKVPFETDLLVKTVRKIHWRSWYKMSSKLHGCIGFLYKVDIKLTVSLCSFSQCSFPFNFQTANALVLKFGTLPFRCFFSNILLAIFDIFFRSKVIHRFVPKNGPKMTCGRVFQHNFISKANLKNPEQRFFVHRFYLLRKQKDCLWQSRFST